MYIVDDQQKIFGCQKTLAVHLGPHTNRAKLQLKNNTALGLRERMKQKVFFDCEGVSVCLCEKQEVQTVQFGVTTLDNQQGERGSTVLIYL